MYKQKGSDTMAMDGILLNRLITKIMEETPLRINRITQPSNHEFVFQLFSGKRLNLLISTHPVFSRIQFTKSKASTNLDNTHLLTLFRKHLDGGIIKEVKQIGFDRIFEFHIDHRDDMGVIRTYKLVVELMGKYANIILINDNGIIVDSLKRLGSFESTQRLIVPGATYEAPTQFDKKHITDLKSRNPELALRQEFEGVSPLLEDEILHRLKEESEVSVVDELLNSNALWIHGPSFHILELKHLDIPGKRYDLMDGLDYYYRDLQEQDRVKSHTGDLLKVMRRDIKRNKQKLIKLHRELENAQDSDHLKETGDLLFAYASTVSSGHDSITLTNWDNNPVEIALDPRLNGKENANAYFTRYRKAKTSLSYLKEQIQLAQERIQYFENLQVQTEQASVEDAKEIHEELMNAGVIFQKRKSKFPAKKKKPNFLTIQYDDETEIFVGKNNIQNDYVTFKLASKNDMWFHAANTFGAHVIIKSPSLDEPKIRLCAHLAAYYSKARHGSSVEVYYTEARNLKKVPGKQLGLVRVATQKSIFIDPDEAIINAYLP